MIKQLMSQTNKFESLQHVENEDDNEKKEDSLTKEEIEEIKNDKPGDIEDDFKKPSSEDLDQLKKIMEASDFDEATRLISEINKKNNVDINPNNNVYNSVSEKEMLKYKIKQKINQKKLTRSNKNIKIKTQQSNDNRLQKIRELQQIIQSQKIQEHSQHVHNENCKHDA